MKVRLLFLWSIVQVCSIFACTDPFLVFDKNAEVPVRESFEFNALDENSGCDLALVSVAQPINGGKAVADLENNTFIYMAPNTIPLGGLDFFNYTMSAINPDTQEPEMKTAQVTIALTCSEDEFQINAKTGTACSGGSTTFDATEDTSGCGLQLMRVTQPINGGAVVTDFVENTFTYTAPVVSASILTASATEQPCPPIIPTPDQLLVDNFTYTVADENEVEMSAPVTVTVESCEELEVNPKIGQTEPGLCVVFDALEGNSGDLLRLVEVTQPNVVTVLADVANNTFTFQAPATFASSNAKFSYALADVAGVPASASVTVSIALAASAS